MNIILYAPVINVETMKLFDTMQNVSLDVELEVHQTVRSLIRTLCYPAKDLSIAVLYIGNRKELDAFLSIRNLLENLPMILIMPKEEEALIAKAHLLRPRFIAFSGGNSDDLCAVLRKMLKRYERSSQWLEQGQAEP